MRPARTGGAKGDAGVASFCSAGCAHERFHASLLLSGAARRLSSLALCLLLILPAYPQNWNQGGTGLTISREAQVQYNRWFAETVSACVRACAERKSPGNNLFRQYDPPKGVKENDTTAPVTKA